MFTVSKLKQHQKVLKSSDTVSEDTYVTTHGCTSYYFIIKVTKE